MHRDTPRRLRHAAGYIELNMLEEARAELEAIAFEDRLAPPVLTARIELEMAAKHWETVVGMGRELVQKSSDLERGWISWAYALRELGRIEEARDVLLQAEPIHGATSAVLHYNLACYYSLLGELDTARERLDRACVMEPHFKKDSREDPDLKALWGGL